VVSNALVSGCRPGAADSISDRAGQAVPAASKPLQMADNLYLYGGHFAMAGLSLCFAVEETEWED
jgi:hypothetical protein